MAAETPRHLAQNPFQDLSGIDTSKFSNPYDALLEASDNSSTQLQARYSTHRSTRNAQQKEKLLSSDFQGVIIDPILSQIEASKSTELSFEDPRHCLVFWGRPEEHIRTLIGIVQDKLKEFAPNMWVMPRENLHITILEITHSKTAEEIEVLKGQIAGVAEWVVNYTKTGAGRKARLIKPMIGFDASALALSFVPAASAEGDEFSYHHLRRDVYEIVSGAGVKVDSRYVVPSAHLTIGRFITRDDFAGEDGQVDREKMSKFVGKIEEVNRWLEEEYWGDEGQGGWTVGEGDGIVLRWGTVWYGGGHTMAQTTKS